MDSAFNNIDEYNPNQNLKTLTLFAEILSNKNLELIVTEACIKYRKFIRSLVSITKLYYPSQNLYYTKVKTLLYNENFE